MIKRKLYLAGILCLLASIKLYAQDVKPLSLSQAWQLARQRYPEFAEKKAQIKASEYQKSLVKNRYLPQLQVQLQNTYGTYAGSSGAFFPLPGIFNVSGNLQVGGQPDATTSFYSSAVVDWKLLEFGRRSKEVEAATYRQEAAKSSLTATELAVQARVSRLYLTILYNQANLGWAKANAARLQEILALSKSMADAGLKPGADSLLTRSAYQQALAESNSWQGKLIASKVQLTEIIALSADSFRISSSFYLAGTRTAAAQGAEIRTDHPYLDVLHQQAKLGRAQQQLASRSVFPSLSFLGGVSARGSGIGADANGSDSWQAGFENSANNYLVGLGLTWNLTAAYNSGLESKEAEQQLLAAKARYDRQALQLNSTLQAVEARMQEQLKQLSGTAQAVQSARAAYDLYLSRYESGLISMTELLQLQLLLQQSEKSNIEAYQQFWDQVILQSEMAGDFSYLSNQF